MNMTKHKFLSTYSTACPSSTIGSSWNTDIVCWTSSFSRFGVDWGVVRMSTQVKWFSLIFGRKIGNCAVGILTSETDCIILTVKVVIVIIDAIIEASESSSYTLVVLDTSMRWWVFCTTVNLVNSNLPSSFKSCSCKDVLSSYSLTCHYLLL